MAPAVLTRRPRILYLDAYDSSSNNIIAQVEQCIDADVVKCYIDSDPDSWTLSDSAQLDKKETDIRDDWATKFVKFVRSFDGVIAGPGPGSAACDGDVGWMEELWKLQESDLVPVLGICLGFQSMCFAFGAEITKLKELRHGLVAEILHHGASIFNNVKELHATQYHSLQVMLNHRIQTTKAVQYPAELWEPTESCPDLQPLAWDFDNKQNGAVLMAIRHTKKPFWGVQFHPESICTNEESEKIIRNWWEEANLWDRRRDAKILDESDIISGTIDNGVRKPISSSIERLNKLLLQGNDDSEAPFRQIIDVQSATTGSGRLTVSDIVELFDGPRGEVIVLESGLQRDLLPSKTGTGRHSIIGLVIPGETTRLHYYADSRSMQMRDGNDQIVQKWYCDDPWLWIRSLMAGLRGCLGLKPKTRTWAPFWGGFMGYVSYEAGLQTINVQSRKESNCPDICFTYVTRSIVVDHQLKKIHVQSIREGNDMAWINESVEKLYEAVGRKSLESTPDRTPLPRPNPFEDTKLNTYLASCSQHVANRDDYCTSVELCQEHIADGQSYELCLTTKNEIHALRPLDFDLSQAEDNELSWKLYKRLTSRNTAPFSAYMRLHNVHLLSSSPERFVSWDREQMAQCRPIKGIVAKGLGITAADAYDILSTPKERAENLMIVDLTRHQLHGVYGAGNVRVSQFMQVEEYDTLWQLVSVIEGIPPSISSQQSQAPDYMWQDAKARTCFERYKLDEEQMLGFDAFRHSLPAGSMTGAPKKRSCELLQDLEGGQRRGIYSGVLGYLDIGGGGDFSVIIRSAVKIDSPSSDSTTNDTWTIGAGGAITALSDPAVEYDEMIAKFQSTAAAFEPECEVEEVDKGQDLRGVWSRLMEVEEADDGEEIEGADAPLLLRTLQDFQAGLMSGMVRTAGGRM